MTGRKFSTSKMLALAEKANVICEVGVNPYGSSPVWWCKILHYIGPGQLDYESTYDECSGSLDAAFAGAWDKFEKKLRDQARDADKTATSARETLERMRS